MVSHGLGEEILFSRTALGSCVAWAGYGRSSLQVGMKSWWRGWTGTHWQHGSRLWSRTKGACSYGMECLGQNQRKSQLDASTIHGESRSPNRIPLWFHLFKVKTKYRSEFCMLWRKRRIGSNYTNLWNKKEKDFVNSFIQQIFNEHLLCARYYLRH